MSVVFIAHDEKVATWRTVWPARELRKRGYEVGVYGVAGVPTPKVEPTGDVTYVIHIINRAWNLGGRLYTFADTVRRALQLGRVILDCDDDWTKMLHIQPRPTDEASRQNWVNSKLVHQQIPEMIRMADAVIVSTPRLAEVYGKWAKEVHIVENTMPEWVLDMPRVPRQECVAWMGEMYLHGMDWNLLQPFAADLPPLRLVGAGRAAEEVIRSWGVRDVETTGVILDQRKLYREVGRAVAAVIPLDDTPFNRGKSWSKPMEFMARGVQPIASKHVEYERLDVLTGALPTYSEPEELVAAVNEAWENRPDGDRLPDRLRDAGLTMETGGGDAWEKALA